MPDSAGDSSQGRPAPFPSTMWSEVLALQSTGDERRRDRMAKLIERYWRPVFWAVRSYGEMPPEAARDLTQEFFVRILEGQVIGTVDRDRGSFRHYLRGALKHFLLDEWKRDRTQKRGGGRKLLSLDFDDAGPEPPALGGDPSAALDRAWGIQILDEAMRELEGSLAEAGRARDAELFRAYELAPATDRPSYAALSERFGLPPAEVQNSLRFCRRRLRAILLQKVGAYVRDESELFDELRELFGE